MLQPQGTTATAQSQPAQQQTQVMNSNLNNFNQNTSNANSTANNTTQQQTVSLSQINFASLANNGGVQLQTLNTANRNNNNNVVNAQGQVNGGTPIKTLLEEDDKEVDNDLDNDNGPTIANMPAANNLGMPASRKSLELSLLNLIPLLI